MKIKAVNNKIIIKGFDDPVKGDIYIPDDMKEASIEGTVIAVGDKVVNINEGDHIMFNPHKTTKVSIQDVKYLIIEVEHVFVVLEENNA